MRADAELGRGYRSILSHTGLVLALCGPILLWPLVALLWWPAEGHLARGFLIPGLALTAVGLLLWRVTRTRPGAVLTVQDGGVIVLAAWVVVTLASAVPFMLGLRLSFVSALFESVSGWTTTGLSVVDVEHAPRTILLWRSTMQLAGGAGIAVILVSIGGGPLGPGLSIAEGRGDQLVAHVRRSARIVLGIYSGYALACTGALRVAGMTWFDATNHAFTAVSTGGFSTHAASLGYWDSPLVEAVTLPFMLAGATNFQIAHLLLRGRPRLALGSNEPRTVFLLLVVAIPLLALLGTGALYTGAGAAVRAAIFEGVSAVTTTGFSTSAGAVYRGWPRIAVSLLVPLMVIGGGTGSTAGGIKQQRAYLLARALGWELRRLSRPGRWIVDTSVRRVDQRSPVSDRAIVRAAVYVVAYLGLLGIGVMLLIASGYDVLDSLFEFASALGTVGLSVGVTGASTPALILWAQMVGMLLGRLEIFIVLVALRKLWVDGIGLLRRGRKVAAPGDTSGRGRATQVHASDTQPLAP